MIAFLIVSALILILSQNIVLKKSLDKVDYKSEISKKLVAPGEIFEIIVTITNNSKFFIPFIRIEQMLPKEIELYDNEKRYVNLDNKISIKSTTFMMPRSKIVRRMKASLPTRGSYYLNETTLHGGDFLGIKERPKVYRFLNEVVVYPKKTNERELELMSRGILGEISVKRFMIEDPLLTIGFREYSGREPMKHIDWNQSAKNNELIVKQFDYTIDPSVTVVLDVSEKMEKDKKEVLFSLTRTVTEQLTNLKIKFSFLTNATILNKWYYIIEKSGSEHLNTILDLLGRATHSYSLSFEELIKDAVGKEIEENSLVVLITSKSEASLQEEINFLKTKRIQIYLV